MDDEDKQAVIIAHNEAIAGFLATSELLHRLWTAHCSHYYDKDVHKPLWLELQRRIEQ